MPQVLAGTFSTGSNPAAGNVSGPLPIPTSTTTMRLTVDGLDANNTVRTQKRGAGGAWTDQTTYSSNQSNAAVTVAAGEEWRLVQLTQQAIRDVRYSLSVQS